jgi:hypothetical protein
MLRRSYGFLERFVGRRYEPHDDSDGYFFVSKISTLGIRTTSGSHASVTS